MCTFSKETEGSDPKSTAANAESPAGPIGNFSAALSWQLKADGSCKARPGDQHLTQGHIMSLAQS